MRRIEELTAAQLAIDPNVQRKEPPRSAVEKMVKTWNRDATGVLTASLRADGVHYLIDGQTRRAAALECDPTFLFVVEVHEGLGVPDEIDLFEWHNKNRREVSAIELLRLRVNRGREPYGTVGTHLARRGLKLGHTARTENASTIMAAQPIEWLLQYTPNGKRMVPDVLDVIMDAFPFEGSRWRGVFFLGVAKVVAAAKATKGMDLDRPRLVRVLQRYLPRLWEQKAQLERAKRFDPDGGSNVGSGSSSLGTVVAKLMVTEYNKRIAAKNQIEWVD